MTATRRGFGYHLAAGGVRGGLSLRLRLVLAGAVAVVVAPGLAAAGHSALFPTHVERRAMAELSVQLDQLLAGLARGANELTLATPPADSRFARPYGGLYWQIEAEDQLLPSRSLWDTTLAPPPQAMADGQAHAHRLAGPEAVLKLERSVALPARLGGAIPKREPPTGLFIGDACPRGLQRAFCLSARNSGFGRRERESLRRRPP